MSYDRKNLVVLMYADNNRFTTVVRANDPRVKKAGIVINEKKGIWTAPISEDSARTETKKIGRSWLISRARRQGVIGVYDRTNIRHLEAMLSDGQDAVD